MDGVVEAIQAFFSRPGAEDIFELTYAYTIEADRYFNRTLFEIYAELSPQLSAQELLTLTRDRLTQDQATLLHLEEKLAPWHDRRAPLFHKTLSYAQKIWSLVWRAVPFEIQKRYPELPRDPACDICLHNVQQIDYELFGYPIMHDTREVSRSYSHLVYALDLYGDTLDKKEYKIFQKYLSDIAALPACNPSISQLLMPSSFLDDSRFDIPVPRGIYTRLFELVFAFYDLPISILVDERSSIYDGREVLYFPDSEAYDVLSLGKVLELIAHEIEVHYIVLRNTDRILAGVKGGRNLAREEGLAILHEYMLNGYALEDFDIRPNIPTLLVGELLQGEQYQDFLTIYRKLHGFIPRGIEYLLRRKRNYPFGRQGILHKDVNYSRGMYQIRGRLLEDGRYDDLFLAKTDMEDILLVAEHAHQEELLVVFPKLLGMRMVGYILTGKQDTSTWLKKLQKKYKFLSEVVFEPFTSTQQQIRQELLTLLDTLKTQENHLH